MELFMMILLIGALFTFAIWAVTPMNAAEKAQIGRPIWDRAPTEQEHAAAMIRFLQDKVVL